MNRLAAPVVVSLVLLATFAPIVTLGATETPSDDDAPGARLAGVVGVQGAEVRSEVATRSLDRRLANADSNSSKAAVVADSAASIEERLAELRERRQDVENAYENGSISRAVYEARMATIAAESNALQAQANRTSEAAETLPADVLRDAGINVTAIQHLAQNASELGGGAAAEAAQNIAGRGAGAGLSDEPDDRRPGTPDSVGDGPPGESVNETDDGGYGSDDADDATNSTGSDSGNDTAGDGSDAGDGTSDAGDGGSDTANDGSDDGSDDGEDAATTETETDRS